MWQYYAILSAVFAALTAIFAKVGVKDMDSDLATAIRTVVILCITWGIVLFGGKVGGMGAIGGRNWIFLILSGVDCRGSSISRPCSWAMLRKWRR